MPKKAILHINLAISWHGEAFSNSFTLKLGLKTLKLWEITILYRDSVPQNSLLTIICGGVVVHC